MQLDTHREKNSNAKNIRPRELFDNDSETGAQSTCFAALYFPGEEAAGAHITVGNNRCATADDIARIRAGFSKIEELLPLTIQIGNFCLRGGANEYPTYNCRVFANHMAQKALEDFYRHNYRGTPGKYLFPQLEMHVTVDTPERRAYIEELIVAHNGFVRIEHAAIDVRSDAADASAVYDDATWTCLRCAHVNDIAVRTCAGRTGGVCCTQWRPRAAMPRRDGDWECCDEMQFASRATCRKCHAPNPKQRTLAGGESDRNLQLISQFFTGAPRPPPSERRVGDWECVKCGDFQFARNDQCRRCDARRVK